MDDGRYKNIPISERTIKGMSLNIDDLGAIARLLSLQDNVYDEQFEKMDKKFDHLFSLMDSQSIAILSIVETLKFLREEIHEIKEEIKNLQVEVKCTQIDLDALSKKVRKIEGEIVIIKEKIGI